MAEAQPELLEVALDDLIGPPLPPLAERAWAVFGQLNGTRASGMQGVAPITFTELAAFQDVTGTRLTPLDVALVREADAVFVQIALQRMKPTDGPSVATTTTPED